LWPRYLLTILLCYFRLVGVFHFRCRLVKIPNKGRYALCALFAVALQETRPVSVTQIARELDISLSYLEQLFARLRRAGLVVGLRGVGGGYRLARPPEEITVLDVLQAVGALDGPPPRSDYLPEFLWNDLSRELAGFLAELTLAELIARGTREAPAPA